MLLRARAAFTLLELLVALIVINAGLLALVSAVAVLVRRQTELHERVTAGELAANRLQALAELPCGSRSDSARRSGFTEHWSEDDAGNHVRELRDSVTFAAFGEPHSLTLTTRLTC
jgi:Tfp pilus assembly protein PilV